METKEIIEAIKSLPTDDLDSLISNLNEIKKAAHEISPFKTEPVDCVLWVKGENIAANDYNPNSVAPPEMELLKLSILEDGYTQPIVGWMEGDDLEVIDGFHRNRVGKEYESVRNRVHGYLPVVVANADRLDKGDRMASTIRHNRARGKHSVQSMSDIVVELKRRNWSDDKIAKSLGMDKDEILRLCQITGLAELFTDQEFSKSWDIEGEVTEADFEELSDDVEDYEDEGFRKVSVNGKDRIFHTYDKWECYKAGFYKTTKEGMTKDQCEQAYKEFLSDTDRFSSTLEKVTSEWKHSCEHYLTNETMNRIAWLGQAACCYDMGIPSAFRSGFSLLSLEDQEAANNVALEHLNQWLVTNDREPVTMEQAYSTSQSELY